MHFSKSIKYVVVEVIIFQKVIIFLDLFYSLLKYLFFLLIRKSFSGKEENENDVMEFMTNVYMCVALNVNVNECFESSHGIGNVVNIYFEHCHNHNNLTRFILEK